MLIIMKKGAVFIFSFISFVLLLFSLSFISSLESYETVIPQTPGLIWTNQDIGANCEFINSSTFNQYNPMNIPVSVALANKSYLDKFFELYNFEGRRYNIPGFDPTTQRFFSQPNVDSCFISNSNWVVPDNATWQKAFSNGFDGGINSLNLKVNQRYWTSNWIPFGNGNGVLELYVNDSFKILTDVMSPAPSTYGASWYPICKSTWVDSQKTYSIPVNAQWPSFANAFPGFALNGNIPCPLALYRYVRCENENSRTCADDKTISFCSGALVRNISCGANEYCSEGKCKCNTTVNKCTGLQTFSSCNLSSGNFAESSCDSNQQCLGEGSCVKTCAIQGGSTCSEDQRCEGTQIATDDGNERCCSGNCVMPAPQTCNQCGEGLFNLFCDRNECENLVKNPGDGCVFMGNAISGSCVPANLCTGENCDGLRFCEGGNCMNISYVDSCRDLMNDNTYYMLNNSVDVENRDGWTPLNNCQDINEPGKYYLTQNIDSATPFCFNITANDVSIDLNNMAIKGNNEDVNLYPFNVIKTCQDLQNIERDLNGNYVLANDIVCTGVEVGFYSFSGTLDGGGHRIINPNIGAGNLAFIRYLYGSLKNIRFEWDVSASPYSFYAIRTNNGVVSNVYVKYSNPGNTNSIFIRSNVGKVENVYVDMNLHTNIGALVQMNGQGEIKGSYSTSGGLVGTNVYWYQQGSIESSFYGGSGNCVGEGSSTGCTLQVLSAPEYNPQNIDNYATPNSAILINGVDKVNLRNLGNITGFAKKVGVFKSKFMFENSSFPSPDLKFKFDTTLHTKGYVPAKLITNITLIQPAAGDGYYGIAASANGEKLAIGTYYQLFTSSDYGKTLVSSLDRPDWDLDKNYASSADGKNLFVRAWYSSVLFSGDYGASWSEMILPFSGVVSIACSFDATKIYMATYDKLYLSIDSGLSWNEVNSDFFNIRDISSSADGTRLILTASNTVWSSELEANSKTYISNDSGLSWLPITVPYPVIDNVASSANGNKLFISYSNNIYTSNDSGAVWLKIDSPGNIIDFVSTADGNKLFATADGAVYEINLTEKPAVSGYSWNTYSIDDSIKNISGKLANPNSRTYGSPHYTSLPIDLNSSFFVSGVEGSAFNITDKIVYFDASSLDWLNQVNKPKSICIWVKKDKPNDNNSEVFFSMGYPYIHGMVLGSLGDSLVFSSKPSLNQSYSDGYLWNGLVYPHFFKDSNWKQVCLIDEGLDKNMVLYGDGVKLRSKVINNDIYTIWPNYNNQGHLYDAFFGAVDGPSNGYPGYIQSNWKGAIDEAMFWSQALSADEVKNLYNSYELSDYSSDFASDYCFGLKGNNIIFNGNNQEFSLAENGNRAMMKVFDSSKVILKNIHAENFSNGISIENSKGIQLVNNTISSKNSPVIIVSSEIVNFSENKFVSKNSKPLSISGSSFDFNLGDSIELGKVSIDLSSFFVYSDSSGVRLPPVSLESDSGFNFLSNAISVGARSFSLANQSGLYFELKGERLTFETKTQENVPHFTSDLQRARSYGSSILHVNDDTYFGIDDRFCLSSNYGSYVCREDGLICYYCSDYYADVATVISGDSNNDGYFDKPFKIEVTLN